MDHQGNNVGPQDYDPQQTSSPPASPGQNSGQSPQYQEQPAPVSNQPTHTLPSQPQQAPEQLNQAQPGISQLQMNDEPQFQQFSAPQTSPVQYQQFDPRIPDEAASPETGYPEDEVGFQWTDPEFVAHDKSAGWYVRLLAVALVLAGLLYLLTRDLITAGMVIVAGIFLGAYARRKPRMIPYQIYSSGISIGRRQFDYEQFRSFTARQEGQMITITFIPLKRFSPPIGMCYDGKDDEAITAYLSARLPYEHRKPDLIDNFMELIRF